MEHVPETFKEVRLVRGGIFFGFAGRELDRIVSSYDDLEWWLSEKGLNIGPVRSFKPALPPFDELAGRLMMEARERPDRKRLSRTEYEQIATRLDETGFKALDFIPGDAHKKLARWNQKNSKTAVKTFLAIVQRGNQKDLSDVCRAFKKRLYRAEAKFKKQFSGDT